MAKRRNMHYELLGDPIFRERDVPRMLELATARADGDAHRARGAEALPGAQPTAGKAAPRRPVGPVRYRARLGAADRIAADARRRGSASKTAGSSRSSAPAFPAGSRSRSRLGRHPAGLVNAHTHLELSYLRERGAGRHRSSSPGSAASIGARRQRPDARSPEIMDGLDRGIAESLAAGTAVVGDISNTLVPFAPTRGEPAGRRRLLRAASVQRARPGRRRARGARRASARCRRPTDVRASLAAHAPYSVAPAVLRAMRAAIGARCRLAPCSVHLAESGAEVEFIATGQGPWRQLLEDVGSWDPAWIAPGVSPGRVPRRHAAFWIAGAGRPRRPDVDDVTCRA